MNENNFFATLPIESVNGCCWSHGSAKILKSDSENARLELIRRVTAQAEQFTVPVVYAQDLPLLEPKKIINFLSKEKFTPKISVNSRDNTPISITIQLNELECTKRKSKIITRITDSISSDAIDTEGEIFSCREKGCLRNIYLDIIQLTKSDCYSEEKYACLGAKTVEILIRSGHTFNRDDFQGANLTGADFRDIQCHAPLNFEDSVLVGCNFSGLDLNGYIFTGANCEGAIFKGATNMVNAIGLEVNLIAEQPTVEENIGPPREAQPIVMIYQGNQNDLYPESASNDSDAETQTIQTDRTRKNSYKIETDQIEVLSSDRSNQSPLQQLSPKSKSDGTSSDESDMETQRTDRTQRNSGKPETANGHHKSGDQTPVIPVGALNSKVLSTEKEAVAIPPVDRLFGNDLSVGKDTQISMNNTVAGSSNLDVNKTAETTSQAKDSSAESSDRREPSPPPNGGEDATSNSEHTALMATEAPKSKGVLRSICRRIFCCCFQRNK